MSRTVGDVVVALGKGIWTFKLKSLALLAGAIVVMFGAWKVGEWSWGQLDQQASQARWDIQYYRQKGSVKNTDWLERKLLSGKEVGKEVEHKCAQYIMEQQSLLGVWIFLSSSDQAVHRDAARFICFVRAANEKHFLIPWESPKPRDSDFNKLFTLGYKRSYE
ncbi:hypothetical protein OU997_20790 [Pseudomonas sp. SL4(2022)]|uniref:hypothetical protein n=1 Tax=Pseudomonas sp. SL4(2022) TaxID=2994661 RepID=UPI0022702AFE|nr:hypothetical protein [Pseudomonas sp. SL4(2022)]WAC44625.1 hypothetical protein OU997_20790 [Pseudomonas sp. SL4(2022)]